MFQLTEKDVKENTKFACLWLFLKNQSIEKTIVDLDSYGVTKNKNQLSGILFNLKLQIKTVPSVKASFLAALGEDYERIMALEQWISVGFRNKNKSSITVITNSNPVILPESNISASPFAIRKERKSAKPKLKLIKSEPVIIKEPSPVNESICAKEPVNNNEPVNNKEPSQPNESSLKIESNGESEPPSLKEPDQSIEPQFIKESIDANESLSTKEPNDVNESFRLKEISRLNESHLPKETSKSSEPVPRVEPYDDNESSTNIESCLSNESNQIIESTTNNEPYIPKESGKVSEPYSLEPNDVDKPVVLMDLNINTCKFPLWGFYDKPTIDSLYCGNKVDNSLDKSYYSCYCEKHLKIVKGVPVKKFGKSFAKM